MSDLAEFINSDIDIVVETAKQAEIYRIQYESGLLSANEYSELLDDLSNSIRISDYMGNLHTQKVLIQVVDTILKIKAIVNVF